MAANINFILDDIGIQGKSRESTKNYLEKILKDGVDIADGELMSLAGAFSDGFNAAQRES